MMMRFPIVACILLALAAPVFAQESPSLSASLGINYWWANWDQDNVDDSSGSLLGPKVGLAYGRFSFGVVYLAGSFDLDFRGGTTAEADRQDLDIIVQYAIFDYLSAGIGYKRLSYDYKTKTGVKAESTMTGFALGVSGSYPIGQTGLLAYAAASFLPSVNYDDTFITPSEKVTTSDTATGINIEAGLSYMFPQFPLAIDLAYRHQNIDKDVNSDTFSGPAIEVSYSF